MGAGRFDVKTPKLLIWWLVIASALQYPMIHMNWFSIAARLFAVTSWDLTNCFTAARYPVAFFGGLLELVSRRSQFLSQF